MKKKIFIGVATLFFAAFAFYNVQVSQQNGDISLDHVALMAQANNEPGSTGSNVLTRCASHGGQFCSYTFPDGANCNACCLNNWRPECGPFGCKCHPPRP